MRRPNSAYWGRTAWLVARRRAARALPVVISHSQAASSAHCICHVHGSEEGFMLSRVDRERLAKLLGMLGSDHSGERDNAALAIERGLSRAELLQIHPLGFTVVNSRVLYR